MVEWALGVIVSSPTHHYTCSRYRKANPTQVCGFETDLLTSTATTIMWWSGFSKQPCQPIRELHTCDLHPLIMLHCHKHTYLCSTIWTPVTMYTCWEVTTPWRQGSFQKEAAQVVPCNLILVFYLVGRGTVNTREREWPTVRLLESGSIAVALQYTSVCIL